ncbi:MAG: rhamnan synthesis F family protein [Pikeienuella sp.]
MSDAYLDLQAEWNNRIADPHRLSIRPGHLFDQDYYASRNPAAISAGIGAFEHFDAHGRAEGRAPNLYSELRATFPELDERIETILTDKPFLAAIAAGQPGVHELAFELIALGDSHDHVISNFSERHYLETYPDIAKSGIPPLIHFLRYGAAEGRRSLADVRAGFSLGERGFDPNLPTCLICVHDFSKSGAPMVGLDLVRSAARTHNVIVGALRTGELRDLFRAECSAVFVSDRPESEFEYVLPAPHGDFSFAVLNSVECFAFIPLLTARERPFAMYLHEFTEYTSPRYKTVFTSLFPDLLVFSSERVRQSWKPQLNDVGFDAERDSIVLPQHRLTTDALTSEQITVARERLSALIGRDIGERRVIYGAGHAQWRKGTDLFVLAAQMTAQRHAGPEDDDKTPIFVWIGDGVNHEDPHFGVWLDKHMRAAGVGSVDANLHFLPAGPYYSSICQAADGMFLSSRLDPLPNVAFDSVKAGGQVVLFTGATGFDDEDYADHPALRPVGYGRMDEVLSAIAAIPRKTATTGDAAAQDPIDAFTEISVALTGRTQARRRFVIGRGAYDLPVMAPGGREFIDQRRREREKIWTLGRRFIWRSADDARGEIAASDNWVHQHLSIQPYATAQEALPAFGIHIHAYYLDGLEQDIAAHRAISAARRIVVTTDTAHKKDQIEGIFRGFGLHPEVHLIANQGRDILPFMRLFMNDGPGKDEELWCHVHQKKSIGSAAAGDVWRAFLLAILLGDAETISAAPALIAQGENGLVGAFDHYIVGWAASQRILGTVAPKLAGPLPEHPILFPVGNMFWVRREVVERMNALFGPNYQWPNEPLANDGTVYHMIERLWPAMAAELGLNSLFLSKPDQARS